MFQQRLDDAELCAEALTQGGGWRKGKVRRWKKVTSGWAIQLLKRKHFSALPMLIPNVSEGIFPDCSNSGF